MRYASHLAGCVGSLLVAASALAQGAFTITDGPATFTQNPLTGPTGVGPLCDLTLGGPDSADQIVQMSWWYGVGLNRNREFAFSADDLSSSNPRGESSQTQVFTLHQFRARIDTQLVSVDTGAGYVVQTLTATNLTKAPLTLDFFHYADPNLNGTAAFDTASGIERPDTMRLRDITRLGGEYMGLFKLRHQAGVAPAVRNMLTNNILNVYQDDGLPVGGDISVGFQYRFDNIPAGGSRSCTTVLAIGTLAPYIPNGACQVNGNTCVFTTEHDCRARDGTFLGEGTHCDSVCPCDWNESGDLNSQDFFDFLTDFFSGPADYNRDQFTNSQDFFDFVVCFFTAPGTCFP